MKMIPFTEFRKEASALFSAVEEGETIRVTRHGKAIAEIVPFNSDVKKMPSWKRKKVRKIIKGEELSSLILSEREAI